MENIIDKNDDISSILKLFKKFNYTTFNCNYEWILGVTNNGFSPKKARTDCNKTFVNLHDSLINLESPEKLLMVIHNHIWGMTPLPSEIDLKLYWDKDIKYGVTTNEMGMFIIKNTNKLSNDEIDNLLDDFADFNESLVKQFQKDKKIKYDKENDDHKYQLNEYFKNNFEKWADKYKIMLSNYGVKVKFINVKEYNIA